ncbi:MAG: glucan ABC transporter ATP-binding protein/ permease [Rhodospirillales bacterium]|jgi:ATP-binding cassette subfamily B protein|nr:glucan ABC transporter ATP-binding protein/ permease [Rhodospirillales bacterium]
MDFVRVYGRVLGMLRPERGLAIALALANLVVAALLYVEPLLFGRIIEVLAGAAGRAADDVWHDSLRLLLIWGVVGLTGIGANILLSLHADRLAHRRRLGAMAQFFEHALSLPPTYHAGTHSGRLLKIMLTGVDNLFGVWLAFFREHLATFVALIVLLPLSLTLNWRLGLLLVALVAVFAVLTVRVVGRTEKAQGAVEAYHARLAMRASDALGNVPLIHSYDRLRAEARTLGFVMKRVLAAQYPVLNLWAVVSVLTRAASTVTVIAIFVLGTWLFVRGQATVGEIVSFMGFATLLIGRLEQAMAFVSRLFFQMHGIGQFFEVLDTQSPVREKPGAAPLPRPKGRVEFDNVTFSYDGRRPAVSDLRFHVEPGETVALVGTTGSGKSTTMALLLRLADPQAGSIRIDGIDIRDVRLDSLRQAIGVVFQDSTLFYRTIAENLRVGRPNATAAEIEAAAIRAQAHEFITRQPQGYDTPVGERGATLSGGERQRIAIARALLKDPPILILDEATSALDAATEAKVQRALTELMAGRTTFVIAHRLSTIRGANQILVFRDGRIVERGTFDELTRAGGAFADLVSSQLASAAVSATAPATAPPSAT